MRAKTHLKRAIEALRKAADELEAAAQLIEPSGQARPSVRPDAGETAISVAASLFYQAMQANSEKLYGRMTLADVSSAIGVEVRHGDRVSFGMAIRQFGAKRGRSGSERYYIFGDSAKR